MDDYSRYTWVLFLANKDDVIDAFKVLCKKIHMSFGKIENPILVISKFLDANVLF